MADHAQATARLIDRPGGFHPPRTGRIDEIPSLRTLDVTTLADGLSYGHSGYVERGFAHEKGFYRDIVSMAGFDAGERVLDLGCGFGRWSVFLAEVNRTVAGVDPMGGRLHIARNLSRHLGLDNAHYVTGDAADLPFPDGSFDAAWCFSALHYIDRDRGLAELHRVLVPGGRLFVALYFGLGRMIALLCDAFTSHGRDHPDFRFAMQALRAGPNVGGPPNFSTGEGLAGMFAAQGFEITRRVGLDDGPVGFATPSEARLLASPAAVAARFLEDTEFRNWLIAECPRLTRAFDYNLSFVATAA